MKHIATPLLVSLTMTISLGCSSPDGRLAELADRVVTQQSEQNARTAQQAQEIAEASRELVEADALSRREMIEAHQRLQGDVSEQRLLVDRQRDKLESERRQIASERQRAPVVAGAITAAGLLIAMLLPLVVSVYLLRYLAAAPEPAPEPVQLLTEELISSDSPPVLADETTRPRISS